MIGLPPPAKPLMPAGLMVIKVPAFDLTSLIFAFTLLRATSMLKIKPILIASIKIIAPLRSGLRIEFFMPRDITFIIVSILLR